MRNNQISAVFGIILLMLSFLTGVEAKELVFYFDADYPVKWVSRSAAIGIRDLGLSLGVEVMDAQALASWMEEKTGGGAESTLVVMANDIAPDTILGAGMTPMALMRRYLDAGGGMLWIGDVPLYWVGKPGKEMIKWDYKGSRAVLGFDTVGDWATRSMGVPNETGMSLGLEQSWASERALPPATVDWVLAINEKGNASGWIKKFSDNPDAVGLVRIWDAGLSGIDDEREADIFILLYNLGFISTKGQLEGEISIPPEDEHLSLYSFSEGRLFREVAVKVINPEEESRDFFIRIKVDGMVFGEPVAISSSSRPYWKKFVSVPLLRSDQMIEFVAGDQVLASAAMDEQSFIGGVELKAAMPGRIGAFQPVDYGRLLVPAHVLLLPGVDSFVAEFKAAWLEMESVELDLRFLLGPDGKEIFSQSVPISGSESLVMDIGPVVVDPIHGPMKLKVVGAIENWEVFSREFTIVAAHKLPGAGGFGAVYADIGYDGQVWNYDRETEEWSARDWDDVWRLEARDDVVVSLPNGQRFVFWKGSGYVPFWASTGNVAMTYEWLEAAWGRNGLEDCIEPLQDKDVRYSRVKILSSTHARAVVAWRYALNDLNYEICDDEWAEEIFTFYPDGFGTRTVTGWIVPGTWHEANEFIIFLPPGVNPFGVLPKRMVTILGPDGQKSEVTYPKPRPEWTNGDPAVFRIHWHKDDPFTPIMATRKFDHFIVAYDGWSVGGRYISPSYWGTHYPVTRGWPTTVSPPPMWRQTPSHASLLAVESAPTERVKIGPTRERVTWSWLIGNTDGGDEELLRIADTWLDPPTVTLADATEAEYDIAERAWGLEVDGAEGSVTFYLETGSAMNPAFILRGLDARDLKVSVNGEAVAAMVGVERDFESVQTVIFLQSELKKDAGIRISW